MTSKDTESEEKIRQELKSSFEKQFLPSWYPKAVDDRYGGFLTNLDADWNPEKHQDKFLIGQCRHLWFTSKYGKRTGDPRFQQLASGGYHFLINHMRDAGRGGFINRVSRSGKRRRFPFKGTQKIEYANAFAIYGLAGYYDLTGDHDALNHARSAFQWIEDHSRDPEYGGYINQTHPLSRWKHFRQFRLRTGERVTSQRKSANSSLHLMEAFSELYTLWPDETLRSRVEELLRQFMEAFLDKRGFLVNYFHRDWEPINERELPANNRGFSWGHDVEAAYLMLEASRSIRHRDWHEHLAAARLLVDHALDTGWDNRLGGLRAQGMYRHSYRQPSVVDGRKIWWVQAEALNALLLMSRLFPDDDRYRRAFFQQWRYIQSQLIDNKRGGWYRFGLDTDSDTGMRPKSGRWKATYHDGRAYMNCIDMLENDFNLTRTPR